MHSLVGSSCTHLLLCCCLFRCAQEKRAEIKESGDAQYAGLDSKGITKKLNAVWKKMSAEAKAVLSLSLACLLLSR